MDFREFLKSLVRSLFDGLRRNKLPASLSAITLILCTALAFTSDYDERPRYRELILPKVNKAERQFFAIMQQAEKEPDELRRLHYFLEGHRPAKTALRVVREEHPMTACGRKAQGELVRYYELIDEQLAIIRTELSFKESYDYISEWKRRNAELLVFRERWMAWLQAPA
jgi:hypothetical protein